MVRDLCSQVAGTTHTPSDLSGNGLAEAFDSSLLDIPTYDRMASLALLPSRAKLDRTISIALDRALNCKECFNRKELARQIQDLYDKDPEDYTEYDRRSLALVYALMALGRRHEPPTMEETISTRPEGMVLQGIAYFRASRYILDTTDEHDLIYLRTLIVLASYMLSSSMMSKAYSYICTGVGVALRLGLHVSSSALRNKFSPEELTERRQVFAVLNLMDTYISSILGMPKILRDADLDQTVPVPEEELHDLGTSFVRRDPMSPASETVLCAKLFQVQARILQSHFPTDKTGAGQGGKYEEEYQGIADREAELQEWHEQLPELPLASVDGRALRTQLLLRLFYACVRISLYRSFLPHVIRRRSDPDFNYRGYTCGSACIESSMQAIWLIDTFDQHGYLHEAQWFTIFVLTLAATSLMLFVLGTHDGPTVEESRSAALKAQELLRKLGARNVSARRCCDSLTALPQAFRRQESGSVGAAGGMSPRSQFMIGIGALRPPPPGSQSESEGESSGSDML